MRREVPESRTGSPADGVDGAALADEALAQHRGERAAAGLGAMLRAHFVAKGDETAVRVLDCAAILGRADDLAAAVGCTTAAVYDAHRRLKYHAQRLAREDDAAGPGARRGQVERGTAKEKVSS